MLNLAIGDWLIVQVSANSFDYGASQVALSDGTNRLERGNDLYNYDMTNYVQRLFVGEVTVANANATVRATFEGSVPNRRINVLQLRPSAGSRVNVYKRNNGDGLGGASTAVATGSLDLVGDDVVFVAMALSGDDVTWSSRQIGGAAADGYSANGRSQLWYRSFVADAASVSGTATLSSSAGWIADYIVLRAVAAETRTSTYAGASSATRLTLSTPPSGDFLVCGWSRPDAPTGDRPYNRGNLLTAFLSGAGLGIWLLVSNIDGDAQYEGIDRWNGNSMIGASSPETNMGDYTLHIDNTNEPIESEAYGWIFWAFQFVNDAANSQIIVRQWLKLGLGGRLKGFNYSGGLDDGVHDPLTWDYAETFSYATLRGYLISQGWTSEAAAAWSPGYMSSMIFGYDAASTANVRVYERTTQPTLAEIDAIALNPDADTSAYSDVSLEWVSGAPVLDDRSGHSHPLTITGTATEGLPFYMTEGEASGLSIPVAMHHRKMQGVS
jgi:hypothetical protein